MLIKCSVLYGASNLGIHKQWSSWILMYSKDFWRNLYRFSNEEIRSKMGIEWSFFRHNKSKQLFRYGYIHKTGDMRLPKEKNIQWIFLSSETNRIEKIMKNAYLPRFLGLWNDCIEWWNSATINFSSYCYSLCLST